MFVGHLIGDFLLQTAWMADRKENQWIPLLVHCFVYTATITLLALPAGGHEGGGVGRLYGSLPARA